MMAMERLSPLMNPSSSSVQVAAIQRACEARVEANLAATEVMIREATANGAQIVCLQELFLSPYPCQTEDHTRFDLAEPIPGPTTERLSALAEELKIVLIASLFEKRAAGLYHNTAIVLDADGGLVGRYRKMHIPDDPYYYEKFYFTPGDLGFQSFPTRYGRVGVCVCWDQWFPEAARLTAMRGAQILVYPTAIGWLREEKDEFGASQCSAWETMMRSHAIANGVFVVAPNRVGIEGQLEFWGQSFIADPNGNLLAKAGQETQILAAECPLEQIDVVRTHWPFFRDRRIDAYQELQSRYLADE